MGGGGGKGGKGNSSKFSIPPEISQAQLEIANVAGERFNRQRPLVETSAAQLSELLNTGGVGARVPIVANAVAAQERALTNTQASLAEGTERGGITGPVADRLNRQLERTAGTAIRSIGPNITAPLASANVTNAIGAGTGALRGFQGGINALARSNTRSTGGPNFNAVGTGRAIASLASGLGGAKTGSGFNTFQGGGGSGLGDRFNNITPTGGFGPGIGFE